MINSNKIFLLRHGETLWNTERRLQGHKNSILTRKGRGQARHNGSKLRNLIDSVPHMVSSPLGRCRETAAIVAEEIGIAPSCIEYDDRVKELAYGRWEGQKMTDIEVEDADAFQARKADRWEVPAPEGESYACLLYTSPSPRDATLSRMPSSA